MSNVVTTTATTRDIHVESQANVVYPRKDTEDDAPRYAVTPHPPTPRQDK